MTKDKGGGLLEAYKKRIEATMQSNTFKTPVTVEGFIADSVLVFFWDDEDIKHKVHLDAIESAYDNMLKAITSTDDINYQMQFLNLKIFVDTYVVEGKTPTEYLLKTYADTFLPDVAGMEEKAGFYQNDSIRATSEDVKKLMAIPTDKEITRYICHNALQVCYALVLQQVRTGQPIRICSKCHTWFTPNKWKHGRKYCSICKTIMAHEQTEESQGKLHYRYYHKIQQSLNRQIKNAKGEAQKEKIKMKEGLEQAYKKPKGDFEKLKSVYKYNEKHSKWSPSSKSMDSIELVNKVTKALEEGETEARRNNRIQELELKLRDRQYVLNIDDINELKKLRTEAKSKKGRKDEDGK